MKRLIAATAFLLVILCTSIFGIFQCAAVHNYSQEALSQIATYAKAGRLEEAAGLAGQFFDFWNRAQDSMVWYLRHEPLEKITSISSRLQTLALLEERSILLTEISELQVHLDELYRGELPIWQNLV